MTLATQTTSRSAAASARLARVLYVVADWLPSSLLSAFAAVAARQVGSRKFKGLNGNARALVRALRPDWAADEATLDAAVARIWSCAGRVIAEIPHSTTMEGRNSFDDLAFVDAALASGRPVIALFLHLGNWEVAGQHIALKAGRDRCADIYDRLDDTTMAAIAMQFRGRAGGTFLPQSRMVWRAVVRHLERPGGGVLFAAADDYRDQSVAAPRFGRPLRADGNIGKLVRIALRTDAILFAFYGERLPHQRFLTRILPFPLEGDASNDDDVNAALARIDAALQEHVVRLLDQWFLALFYTGPARLGP